MPQQNYSGGQSIGQSGSGSESASASRGNLSGIGQSIRSGSESASASRRSCRVLGGADLVLVEAIDALLSHGGNGGGGGGGGGWNHRMKWVLAESAAVLDLDMEAR